MFVPNYANPQDNVITRCVCLGRSSFTTKDMREGDDVNQGGFCIFHPRSNLNGFFSFVVSRSTVAVGTRYYTVDLCTKKMIYVAVMNPC